MPPEEQDNQETSIRDDFESAIEAIEEDAPSATTTETQAAADEVSESLNDDGEETEAETKTEIEAEAKEISGKEPDTENDDKPAPDTEIADGAPVGWSPSAREGWKDLTPEMQTHITKREREIELSLNNGAENRKAGERFNEMGNRYAQTFAAEGVPDAVTGAEELFKTVALLQGGSPEQKAQKIAGFIDRYGININMLDDILSGTVAKPATDPNDPITKMLNERLAPVDNLLAKMTQQEQNTQYQANQDAISAVATFKQGAEFYTDVQNDMADMVEMAEKRGITMPLQEAYDKACALNPEISKVLAKREADEKLIGGAQSIAAKRLAASSINGKQGGTTDNSEDLSMRDTIAAQFDQQTG